MKSSKKLRRATKSNNGHQSWKNQNGQEKTKTSNEGHKKSKWKPGFTFRYLFCLFWFFHCSLCQPPFVGPESKQMNENGSEKCSLLFFVARFGVGDVFPFAVRCFCCSSLLVLVFEIEFKKPKQANAFDCSFWLFAARFGVL